MSAQDVSLSGGVSIPSASVSLVSADVSLPSTDVTLNPSSGGS